MEYKRKLTLALFGNISTIEWAEGETDRTLGHMIGRADEVKASTNALDPTNPVEYLSGIFELSTADEVFSSEKLYAPASIMREIKKNLIGGVEFAMRVIAVNGPKASYKFSILHLAAISDDPLHDLRELISISETPAEEPAPVAAKTKSK